MTINTNYEFIGGRLSEDGDVIETFVAEQDIVFGRALVAGSVASEQVKLPSSIDDIFRGIAITSQTIPQNDFGVGTYPLGSTLGVLRRGKIWVPVRDAVSADQQAYYIFGDSNYLGFFTNLTTSQTIAIPSGVFRTSASENGLALLEVNLPTANLSSMRDTQTKGLQLTWLSNTTVSLNAGQIFDSTGKSLIVLNAPVTFNSTTNGLNGIDTGSVANNQWYDLLAVDDSTIINPPGCLAVIKGNTPILPEGYDVYEHVGYIKTDGSGNVLNFRQAGNRSTRLYQWDLRIQVLNAGSATTWTAINLASAIPAITPFEYIVAYASVGIGNSIHIRPTGSSADNLQCPAIFTNTVNSDMTYRPAPELIPGVNGSGLPSIDYENLGVSESTSIYVTAYKDYI